MSTMESSLFSQSDITGDAVAVLVLVENSRAMADNWEDVRDHYIPILLKALRKNDTSVPMRVWWLMTSTMSFTDQPSYDYIGSYNEVPNLQSNWSSSNRLSTAMIHRAVEILASTFRGQRTTRHLLLVAAERPVVNARSTSGANSDTRAWHTIANELMQEHIRFHMIVKVGLGATAYHDMWSHISYPEIPAWFQVDESKHSVYLSGKLALADSSSGDNSAATIFNPSANLPNFLTSTKYVSKSLPTTPIHDESVTGQRLTPALRTRRSKTKSGDSTSGMKSDSLTPGLVSYLQQMHGLTKKRTYGQRANKRTIGNEHQVGRGARPILPRLDLSRPSMYGLVHEGNQLVETPLAISPKAKPHVSPPDDAYSEKPTSRSPARAVRGPWIQPLPLSSPTSSPSTSASMNVALRNLSAITPRIPDFTPFKHMTLAPQSLANSFGASLSGVPVRSDVNHSFSHGNLAMNSPWPHGHPSPASSFTSESTYASPAPSPTHISGSAQQEWYNQTSVHRYQTTAHALSSDTFGNIQMSHGHSSTTPLPSPNLVSTTNQNADPGDQPFVVTPEYEAFANAQYENALRSTGMPRVPSSSPSPPESMSYASQDSMSYSTTDTSSYRHDEYVHNSSSPQGASSYFIHQGDTLNNASHQRHPYTVMQNNHTGYVGHETPDRWYGT